LFRTPICAELGWNATLIEGDAADGVARLKAEPDGDLFLIGCGELATYLLTKGLVDELRFWIHPAIWGEGTRPFMVRRCECDCSNPPPTTRGVVLTRYEPLPG
jgi:dihydrofolate reductase